MDNFEYTNSYKKMYNIPEDIINVATKTEKKIQKQFYKIKKIKEYNQLKVIKAFHDNKVSETHFHPTSGYGYDDRGRDTLDKVYADIFKTEDAIVRQSISTGTEAIATVFYGCLKPGDTLLSVTGKPYDTLEDVIGIKGDNPGSLKDYGIKYKQIEAAKDGVPDIDLITQNVNSRIKMVFIQRSKGYLRRPALSIESIKKIVSSVKSKNPECIVFVDNCYGEFVNTLEPTEAKADIIAGSLIKNPGGGLAPCGGYIVGKKRLIEMAASRVTVPGLGKEVGCTVGDPRLLYQGIYLAPHIVAESLKGVVFASAFLKNFDFESYPKYDAIRNDIVQSLYFDTKEQLITFCQSIQEASPVDSYVKPEPWDMPGYDSKVIMAAGTFVQGASIELSADAPIKKPYTGYLQGGLVYENIKLALMISLKNMYDKHLI